MAITQDFFPVTLAAGEKCLVSRGSHLEGITAFLGLNPAPNIQWQMGVGYTFSKTPIHTGDTFTLDIRAETVFDMAGWQFDIAFDPAVLEAIDVSEGNFLKADGGATFFQSGSIDNAAGKITGLSAARFSGGVSGHRHPASGEVQGEIRR